MQTNNIIYADLSTYTPRETITFYEAVFGWKYFEDQGYYMAYTGDKAVAGLYETPEKFKQLRMPHFWMTYMQVGNVRSTVDKVRELGGTVEMVNHDDSFGRVALIRDPQGAGFSISEGDKLINTRTMNEIGTLIWNELHVSDAHSIIPFYQGIFHWTIRESENNNFAIQNAHNEHIADVLQIPNEVKGKYEYWVCTFGVEDLQESCDKIVSNGGATVADEGSRMLCTDDSGQAFFYIQEARTS